MKNFAFATVALAIALVGAMSMGTGAASADVLCKEEPRIEKGVEVCPAPYSVEGDVVASSDDVRLSAAGFQYDCDSTIGLETSKDLGPGKGLEGQVSKWTFSGCTGSCATAAIVGLPMGALFNATTGGSGTLTFDPGGNVQIHAGGCLFLKLSCTYDSTNQPLAMVDYEPRKDPHHFAFGGAGFKRDGESMLCPEKATLSGEYEIEEPEGPVFVSED